MFFFQALLMIAIFAVLGAIVGCFLRRMIGADDAVSTSASRDTYATSAAPVAQPRVSAAPAASPPAETKPAAASAAKLPDPEPVAFQAAPRLASEPVGLMTPPKKNAPARPKVAAKAKAAPKEPAKSVAKASPKATEGKSAVKGKSPAGKAGPAASAGKAAKPPAKPKALAGARRGKPDNLTLINGIGNALEKRLNALGFYHFDQLAAWTPTQAESISREIGFPGRVHRENWIGEAKIFAKGGTTDHAKRVEKGDVATSRKSTARKK